MKRKPLLSRLAAIVLSIINIFEEKKQLNVLVTIIVDMYVLHNHMQNIVHISLLLNFLSIAHEMD